MTQGSVLKQIFIALAALTLATAPVAAKEYVDLELVIATDVSRSIDSDEARLQRQGIAAAFRSKQVIDAIRSGVLRRITVAYIDYSSRDWNKLLIDWRIISDRDSANAFADPLLELPLTFGRRTSISDALEQSHDLIDKTTPKAQGASSTCRATCRTILGASWIPCATRPSHGGSRSTGCRS